MNPETEKWARDKADEIVMKWDASVGENESDSSLALLSEAIAALVTEQAEEIKQRDERIAELERRLRIPFGKLPCAQCGGHHDFDTSIPSAIWNAVIRALPEYLCTTCIVREFAKSGRSFTAQLWDEEFNGLPIEVIIDGQNANAAVAVTEENNRLRVELESLRSEANRAVEVVERKRDGWDASLLKSQRAAEERNDEATADVCCNTAMDIREFADEILAELKGD